MDAKTAGSGLPKRRTVGHIRGYFVRRGASNLRGHAPTNASDVELSHFSTAAQSELFDTDSESDPAQS
jgi:hypothetical protein